MSQQFTSYKNRWGSVFTKPWEHELIIDCCKSPSIVGIIRYIEADTLAEAEYESNRRFKSGEFEATFGAANAQPGNPTPMKENPSPQSPPRKRREEETSLQLTTQSTALVEKKLDKLKKLFNVGFSHMRNAGAQMIGWRVIIGGYLNQAKAELPHGDFEGWVEENFGLAKSTQHRWREFSTLFLAELGKLPKCPATGHLKNKKSAAIILELAPKILDGRTETDFMRDCKLLKAEEEEAPEAKGGFQYNAKRLQKWLEEHHPELKGKSYEELPRAIQKAFAKFELSQRADEDVQANAQEMAESACKHLAGLASSEHFKFVADETLDDLELFAQKLIDRIKELRGPAKTKKP